MGRPDEGIVHMQDSRQLHRLHALPLNDGAEPAAEIGKKQHTEDGVDGNKVARRLAYHLISHHLLSNDKAAAYLADHQCPTVKAIVGAKSGDQLVAVVLADTAFDDREQVRRYDTCVEDGLPSWVIADVDCVAHQALLVLVEVVERPDGEIGSAGHGCLKVGDAVRHPLPASVSSGQSAVRCTSRTEVHFRADLLYDKRRLFVLGANATVRHQKQSHVHEVDRR